MGRLGSRFTARAPRAVPTTDAKLGTIAHAGCIEHQSPGAPSDWLIGRKRRASSNSLSMMTLNDVGIVKTNRLACPDLGT
jgi:hypothetical protein